MSRQPDDHLFRTANYKGGIRMKSGFKVVAGAMVIALTALVTNGRAALAASKPEAPAHAPPTVLISARGLSVDGFFSTEGDACDSQVIETGADCFIADGESGGNGFFQFSNNPTTQMSWSIELDYNNGVGNQIALPVDDDYCVPASGTGEGEQVQGRKVNDFYFETTGLICDTLEGNLNYTGSYVLEGGSTNYSNAIGSGSLSMAILYQDSDTYTSQIQFTGNLGQGGGVN
jgi:hypothetical protein